VVTLQYQYIPPGGTNGDSDTVTVTDSGTPVAVSKFPVYLAPGQTTAAQIVTLPDQISGWSTVVTVDKFDPSLGSLLDVLVTIRNDLTGTVAVENLDAQGWRIGFDQSASVSVTPPGLDTLTPATAFDDSTNMLNLGTYDGTADFAGASGTVVSFNGADPQASDIRRRRSIDRCCRSRGLYRSGNDRVNGERYRPVRHDRSAQPAGRGLTIDRRNHLGQLCLWQHAS